MYRSLYYANASLNVATDLLVAILPIKSIWELQMQRTQKIALLVILSLGWLYVLLDPAPHNHNLKIH